MSQNVALLGLGIENLAMIRYLTARGDAVTVCDRRSESELGDRLHELSHRGVKLQSGPGYLADLNRFDTVYRSPGLPLFEPALIAAREEGCRISSAINLFLQICPVPIIGVTGSKGKGTTASLIFHILQQDRQEKPGRIWLGGNIGVAPFSFLGQICADDLVVLELSSFQLEDLARSPLVGVVTNLTPEHLAAGDPNNPNWHHSFEAYVEAKTNIFRHQDRQGVTVLNADQDATRNLAPMAPGRLLWFSISSEVEGCFTADRGQGRQIYIRADGAEHAICTTDAVQLCGEHNLQNICAAAAAAASMGAEPDAVRDAVTAFKGLEHRLEFVREADGIKYYDDSFATTPEASAVAIRAFRGPLVVIAGGADKGSDYRPFAEAILTEKVKAVVLIGVMGDKIGRTLSELAMEMQRPLPKLAEGPEDIKGIVAAAQSLADHGDVVLLSTACASFGLFRNYKERGDLFKQAVWEL